MQEVSIEMGGVIMKEQRQVYMQEVAFVNTSRLSGKYVTWHESNGKPQPKSPIAPGLKKSIAKALVKEFGKK